MLWIALHLPQLPLDTVLRYRLEPAPVSDSRGNACSDAALNTLAAAPFAPAAIVERKRIGWMNRMAWQAGVRRGMSESSAQALAPELKTWPRELVRETRMLHEAALWSLHFTPQVALQSFGLLAEVGASLRLFNGRDQLVSQLAGGLAELGLHVRLASAPTATAAWLLAQSADAGHDGQALPDRLEHVALHTLASARPHLDTFLGIGCATLGQLRRLPRGGLVRRFGPELLRELDRAYGDEPEVHTWFEAPAVFDARIELPSRVENTEALLFAARRLLLQLSGWLNARHAAVAGITLSLHHEGVRHRDHHHTAVSILLANPSRDIGHLTLLLRERLAQLALPAPVIELSLGADRIVEQAAPNNELFPTAASESESLVRLIERLQSRLGAEAVRQLSIFPDHRPECSHASAVPSQQSRRPRKSMPKVSLPSLPRLPVRPAWLLARPLALCTHQHKPFYQSPLTLLAGPERIESGWWDDALAARDYFIAENDAHALLWIFRARPTQETLEPGWFLHGFFA